MNTTTAQDTTLKWQSLVSKLLILVGFIMLFGGALIGGEASNTLCTAGIMGFGVGFPWYIIIQVRLWLYH